MKSHYLKPSDTHPRQAIDREVLFVRKAVGVCDLSALPTLELDAQEAAVRLEGALHGDVPKLKIGDIAHRYLIDQNGVIVADATIFKASAARLHVTLPVGRKGAVQDLIGGDVLDVARIAVSGPKAQELLEKYVSVDLNSKNLPAMQAMQVKLGKVNATLQHVSFTGENGYELIVPAELRKTTMSELTARAEALGGGAYGLDAREVLRIEKGHLSSREMDGTMRAHHLGLGDSVPDVLQLVGLRPCAAVQKLLAGSLMFEQGALAEFTNMQGHVSGVCYSPTLGKMIGMAFVKNGRARMGEKIRAVDLVRDFDTLCEIVDTDFL